MYDDVRAGEGGPAGSILPAQVRGTRDRRGRKGVSALDFGYLASTSGMWVFHEHFIPGT